MDKLKILSGNANRELAERICSFLGVEMGKANVSNFSDGEIQVEIEESVRGMDVFLIQPTCPPVNESLMELFIMLDALETGIDGAGERGHALLRLREAGQKSRPPGPHLGDGSWQTSWRRQARPRILAMDLHVGQIQGFFNIPVDHLYALPVQLKYFSHIDEELVVVSPDAGGVERAREFAKRCKNDASIAIIDKRRERANVSKVMHIVGDVKGKVAILLDDMIDTGGTIVQAAEASYGTARAGSTHAAPTPSSRETRWRGSTTRPYTSSSSRTLSPSTQKQKDLERVEVLDVSPILGEAIKRIHDEASVSSLFV